VGKHTAGTSSDAVDITYHTRGLSETEIAAVTAVITAAVHEQSHDGAHGAEPTPSAWELSARRMRTSLMPGPGAWVHAGNW
jgi:hypothetical protein